jgi:DNA-binding response OmpR family regulator
MKRKLKTILHIEDEPDIREVVRLALEEIGGFAVESCASGEEGLAKAQEHRPDLIVLDVMMPGMDGPMTLRELRKIPELSETPVIFMTAKVQTHEIEEYAGMGAIGVLTKPFDPATISKEIRALWRRRGDE